MNGQESGPPNGSGSAAILAAGIGAFALPLFAIAADKVASIKQLMVFYKANRASVGRHDVGHSGLAGRLGDSQCALARQERRSVARQRGHFYPAWPELAVDVPSSRGSFLNSGPGPETPGRGIEPGALGAL
jgi:hypothetical protein